MRHEIKTEQFFQHGIENYGTFHGNYLNFGLWENNITDYIAASENLLTRVATKIELNKKAHLLDVGCGMGAQDLFFMRTFACKNIQALDLTKKHIRLAQARNTYPNITYAPGNACILPYPDQQFTHIIGIEAPVNFNTRETFFKEAYRVLKKNGKIGIADFTLTRAPKNIIEQSCVRLCAWLWHIPPANRNTHQQYQETLEKTGFTDITIEAVGHHVYKQYYDEQKKVRKIMVNIRGSLVTHIGLFIDYLTYHLYRSGNIEYVLVNARKR